MKIRIGFHGDVREITVPDPTKAEQQKLLEHCIRNLLEQSVQVEAGIDMVFVSPGRFWELIRDQVVEWSLNGYYHKESEDAK